MNPKTKRGCRRVLAMLLVIVSVMSLFAVPAFAGQEDSYHDPAERWLNAGNRTNELDVNATVTHETLHCFACEQTTSFQVWRTPEYTKDGQTAMTRNVRYSDGTLIGGVGTGTILDGTPGINATYTGSHWTKSCCEICGTMNANMGVGDYSFDKNVYWLYDCATAFTEYLDDVVTYEYADATYHKKIVDGGSYCEFCYGTRHTHSETLEPHDLRVDILPQIGNQRFAIVKHCHDCKYTAYEFVAAKAVVADYYGVVDGKTHTLTISDLSEAGVNAVILYGNTAETCTMTTPPSYTEEGQYTVYYQITYSYQGTEMVENGVAYVWLRDESAPDLNDGTGCKCGCGKKDCDCEKGTCPNCEDKDCSKGDHNYIFIETVRPTCDEPGYDRYICTICGQIEKRNYVNIIGHNWQSVLVREADCENGGKVLDICRNCGTVKETVTPKGEHSWITCNVDATCTMPGYTVKECSKCGERQITNLTAVLGHNYKAYVTPATCVTGGKTVYVCERCGDNYVGSYSDPKGHRFDNGTMKVKPSCTGEGLKEYNCLDCGYKYTKTLPAAEHKHGAAATCTEPELCTVCGAVLENAHGHSYQEAATEPTCEKMGYSVFTCAYCCESFKGNYTDALGHDYKAVVTAPTCNDRGFTTYTCTRCGKSYVDHYTDALGHDWDAGTKITDATCNGSGVTEYRCKRCDASYLEAVSATGHKPGPKATCTEPQLCLTCGAVLAKPTGHSYETVVTPATCEKMGYTTCTCRKCGDTWKADYTDALGHDYVAVVTAPTCTDGGFTTYTCSRCGDSYVSDYTDALDHAWNKGEIIAKPSCTADGVVVYTCTVCEREHSQRLPATGHTPGEPASCTEPQLCTVCCAVTERAHGHSFQAEVTEPTCEKMGYTTHTCEDCGISYTDTLKDALGHDYVAVVTEPTCAEMGCTTWTCSRCGKAYVGKYTDPTGHAWDEGTVIAKPSCTGDGVKAFVCLACGEKRIEMIPATGHTPGEPAACTDPQICVTCGAIIEKAHGHNVTAVVTDATCLKMGWTTYTCEDCGLTFKSDYTDALGHDYVPEVTAPTCTEHGYTTFTCSRCGDSYVTDYVDALGHAWDEGRKLISTACNGEGLIDHRCVRCDYHYLEAVSPDGHNPGPEADCIHPQICLACGAVLVQARGHNYVGVVTAPTCTEMGYTTYTCERCGDSYKSDYTKANGHRESDWIIDREPSTEAEGQRHKVCTVCGETLITETIEKLYNLAATDSRGEAVVGGYLVIVTDTDTKNPVANATVVLNKDGTISIRLPDGRILDYADQTTVTVLLNKDKTPVKELLVVVTDRNGNYSAEKTDDAGQITVPGTSGITGPDGGITIGWIDADGNRYTITLKIVDYENGRPIEGAVVTIGKTGNITVTLPDGIDIDAANRILLLLTDNLQKPLPGWTIIVKGDKDTETGKTDEDGILIVPENIRQEKHGAYIVGYPDGTFGPERSMTRSEATAIFARLLAERKGDTIVPVEKTKFEDIPANAWYSGYAKYLNNYGVVYGTEDGKFSPDKPITRAEFVAMAVRFFEVYGDGNPVIMEQYAEFNDVSDGYWAAEYIKDAAIYGWVKGYGDGTFRASQQITRAEVVTIVNRLLDRTADAAYIAGNLRDLNTFSDMEKTHWAYYAVMEAANAHTATFDKEEAWSK
ncbi:MAG: S-layer homology domain-containing protein [Oscillospiraceae bacterium]|nr:S-layer homology domain-containing protein [Oscillospiraceae bacterium]